MNVGLVMFVSLIILTLGYRIYGRIVSRWLGIDPNRPTPAVQINDGVDYVPTKPLVLFGHHYASIAAAGPIIGPTMAVFYGILPVWLWIMLGAIFIGAVHDFTALFLSVRQGGRSVAEVARSALGPAGFVLYVSFAILLCLLVAAAFLNIAVDALTSHYSLSDLSLPSAQTIFKTIPYQYKDQQGQTQTDTHALTGGIATVSVIVITFGALLIGWLLYKRQLSAWKGSLLAIFICAISFWLGFVYQLHLDPYSTFLSIGNIQLSTAQTVLILLLIYCFLAAWLPVWMILQPRDFVNVHVLYFGLACMVVGLIACGLQGVTISAPASNISNASMNPQLGMMWPFLFVTIACGACSGAHGLICGGTSCKQLANEKHAPIIGYGAMLLEAMLGLCVALMIVGPMGFEKYKAIVWPAVGNGSAVRGFAFSVGQTLNTGLGLPIHYGIIFGIILLEGFVLTTTDTVIRLSRYLFEELWETILKQPPVWLKNRYFNTGIVVLIVAWLAFSNGYQVIWPIFGSANQLLAALTLIAATAWLLQKAKKIWFVAIPALFMAFTTITSLLLLLKRYTGSHKWTLSVVDLILICLAAGVVMMTVKRISELRGNVKRIT